MIYVTNGYITNQFETEEQALNHIKAEMDEEELSYKADFDHTEGNVRVIVFQYYTLYMEAFIIHKEFDIRRP